MSDGTLESRGALASRLVVRCQELTDENDRLREALKMRDAEAATLSREVTARGTAVAALREENARHREAVLHWKTEATRLLRDREQLRAHVAALAQAANEMRENFPEGRLQDWEQRLVDVLAAPDLAALVARAEKEQAVIAAARRDHERCPRKARPAEGFLGACNVCAHLAALDTKEP